MPKVAIIILNWNGRVDTLACLASLQHLTYPFDYKLRVRKNSQIEPLRLKRRAAFNNTE